ncbi:PTS glucitol/sorbitol transporter subunit IIC [Enterobacter mori]|uniref:PTS glucitol/sorbitol transporter subunit IIC n=1 Tax=Enterobacter mori TaxID=539813 RepID=UPI001B8D2071|nr:PTS glucitol/sorbitol transporter subunit IIC [Enterobacter mori]
MHAEPQPSTTKLTGGGRNVLVCRADGFIQLYQAASNIIPDLKSRIIPMFATQLLTINFLMKLVGTVRIEKVTNLQGRSGILTYEDALGITAHHLTSLLLHAVLSKLFIADSLTDKMLITFDRNRPSDCLEATCRWKRRSRRKA